MTIIKVENNAALQDTSPIESTDIESLLTYYTIDGQLKCNLNTGITITTNDLAFEMFHVTTSMFWPQISYLIYGTSSLYWLLQQINPEITSTCFDKVEAPAHIRYLPDALTIVANAQY